MKSTLYGTYKEKAGESLLYDMTLEYYLNEEYLCEQFSDLKRYGITIVKTSVYSDMKKTEESKTINDIFYKKEDACNFLDILIKNTVTPLSFQDVVEEYIISSLNMLC